MNKTINTAAARRFAEEHGLQGIVIFAIGEGSYSVTSYGASKAKCRELASVADDIADAVESGDIELSEFLPRGRGSGQ